MPILLKKIEATIISLFSDNDDLTSNVKLNNKVIGEVGVNGYIKLERFEALKQDFKNVGEADFCTSTPTSFGLGKCSTYNDLNISY